MHSFYEDFGQTGDANRRQGKICNFFYLNPEMFFRFKNLYLQNKFTQKITRDIPYSSNHQMVCIVMRESYKNQLSHAAFLVVNITMH